MPPLGPAVGVAGAVFGQDLLEGRLEVDVLLVAQVNPPARPA